MQAIDTDQQNYQILISSLSVSNVQATVSTLIVSPNPPSVEGAASNAAATQSNTNVSTLAQVYQATTCENKEPV